MPAVLPTGYARSKNRKTFSLKGSAPPSPGGSIHVWCDIGYADNGYPGFPAAGSGQRAGQRSAAGQKGDNLDLIPVFDWFFQFLRKGADIVQINFNIIAQ